MATFYCRGRDCPRRWKNFRAPVHTTARCRACGGPAVRLSRLADKGPLYVLRDFPEHYNVSMGCVVKNRKHHQRLQKERGLMDWQPLKESPMLPALRRQGYL